MRYLSLFIIYFLFAAKTFAQNGTITGKVTIKSSGEPLSHASVFLSNATYGTSTAADGTFSLYSVKPGQYELVVTSLGYEDFTQTVVVGKEPIKIDAVMTPAVTQLREVMITSGGSWKRNYEQFVKDFIGDNPDGKQCKILNPKDLNLLNHKTKKYLEGYSYDFLDIENYAIGYKLRILLKEFKSDNLNHIISWTGKVLYQELPGTAAQKAKWAARREEIYYGSAMQFYRSLIHHTMDQDGFVIRILQRKPNTQRPSEELIQQKIEKFKAANNRDSAMFWIRLEDLPKYDEHLIRTPLKVDNVLHATQMPGIYAMAFPGCLYVVYTKKKETYDFKDLYRPLDMENFETSIVTLYNDYVLFDDNGVVVSPNNTLYEGHWSLSKVAQLLPVDYLPEGVKN